MFAFGMGGSAWVFRDQEGVGSAPGVAGIGNEHFLPGAGYNAVDLG